jgi:hypothetical protein
MIEPRQPSQLLLTDDRELKSADLAAITAAQNAWSLLADDFARDRIDLTTTLWVCSRWVQHEAKPAAISISAHTKMKLAVFQSQAAVAAAPILRIASAFRLFHSARVVLCRYPGSQLGPHVEILFVFDVIDGRRHRTIHGRGGNIVSDLVALIPLAREVPALNDDRRAWQMAIRAKKTPPTAWQITLANKDTGVDTHWFMSEKTPDLAFERAARIEHLIDDFRRVPRQTRILSCARLAEERTTVSSTTG